MSEYKETIVNHQENSSDSPESDPLQYKTDDRETQKFMCRVCNMMDEGLFFMSCGCDYHKECYKNYLHGLFGMPPIHNLIPCYRCDTDISFFEMIGHSVFFPSHQAYHRRICRCFKCFNTFVFYLRRKIFERTEIRTKCHRCNTFNLVIFGGIEDNRASFLGQNYDNFLYRTL